MKVKLAPGKYVVAVSGGVDSMVLLDILARQPDIELVVAHFNHGIRGDSDKDEQLVVKAAQRYGLPYAVGRGNMGPKTSEDQARRARYAFLNEVKEDFEAGAVVTAHHQDDLIETALLNLLRGTGPRGLVAIRMNSKIMRPLIDVPKTEIIKYAQQKGVKWREDSSNTELIYLRNYIRHSIVPKLSSDQKSKLLTILEKIAKNQVKKNEIIATISHQIINREEIDRILYTQLPPVVAREVLADWLRKSGFRAFDRQTIERIDIVLRTAQPESKHNVARGLLLSVGKVRARLQRSG